MQRLHRGGRLSRQERLCQAAARSGRLEVLQWLHANDTPWDERTCGLASQSGHTEVYNWALTNGAPLPGMNVL